MFVSLIVPIYNVSKYLEQCLDSIIAQTQQPNEVLLIDDGSTDGSSLIAKRYASQYPHFHYYYKSNGGLSSARNYGLARMKPEGYVAFLDSDDWWEPDFVKIMMANLQEKRADVVVCAVSNDYERYSEIGGLSVRGGVYSIQEIYGHFLISSRMYPCVCNKIYSKALWDTIRFPEGLYFEDLAVTYRIFYQVKQVAICDQALYHYQRRQGSITHPLKLTPKHIDDKFLISNEMKEFLKKHKLYDKYFRHYIAFYLSVVASNFFITLKFSDSCVSDLKKLRGKINQEVFTMFNILTMFPNIRLVFSLLLFKLPDGVLYFIYRNYRKHTKKSKIF